MVKCQASICRKLCDISLDILEFAVVFLQLGLLCRSFVLQIFQSHLPGIQIILELFGTLLFVLKVLVSFSHFVLQLLHLRLQVVLHGLGFGFKPRLWPGLRGLWLSKSSGPATCAGFGFGLAWLGPGHGLYSKKKLKISIIVSCAKSHNRASYSSLSSTKHVLVNPFIIPIIDEKGIPRLFYFRATVFSNMNVVHILINIINISRLNFGRG